MINNMWNSIKNYWNNMWTLLWSKTTVDEKAVATAKEIKRELFINDSIFFLPLFFSHAISRT